MFVYSKRTQTRRASTRLFVYKQSHTSTGAASWSATRLQPQPRKPMDAKWGPKREPSVVWAPYGMFYVLFLLSFTNYMFFLHF